MKKILSIFMAAVLILSLLLLFTGCGEEVLEREEIEELLRESLQVGFTYTEELDQYGGYHYKSDDGIWFKVKQTFTRGEFGYLGKASRAVTCTYLTELLKERGFAEHIDGFTHNGFSFEREEDTYQLKVKLKNYDDIEPAVEFYSAFIDSIEPVPIDLDAYWEHFSRTDMFEYTMVDFRVDNDELDAPRYSNFLARSYVYSNFNDSDYVTDFDVFDNFDKEMLIRDITENMLEISKKYNLDLGIPADIMEREPADEIKRVVLNGEELELEEHYSMHFRWVDSAEDYMVLQLNPIMEKPTYPPVENFKELVELLGGEFSAEEYSARWSIGDDEWIAEDDVFTKNGEELLLDKLMLNERVYYTTSDLEKLLPVTVTWNNAEAVIYIDSVEEE